MIRPTRKRIYTLHSRNEKDGYIHTIYLSNIALEEEDNLREISSHFVNDASPLVKQGYEQELVEGTVVLYADEMNAYQEKCYYFEIMEPVNDPFLKAIPSEFQGTGRVK